MGLELANHHLDCHMGLDHQRATWTTRHSTRGTPSSDLSVRNGKFEGAWPGRIWQGLASTLESISQLQYSRLFKTWFKTGPSS